MQCFCILNRFGNQCADIGLGKFGGNAVVLQIVQKQQIVDDVGYIIDRRVDGGDRFVENIRIFVTPAADDVDVPFDNGDGGFDFM